MIVLLLVAFAVIAVCELPPLIREKRWRELTAFAVLYVLALALSSMLTLGVTPPSPMRGVMYLIKDVLHLSYK